MCPQLAKAWRDAGARRDRRRELHPNGKGMVALEFTNRPGVPSSCYEFCVATKSFGQVVADVPAGRIKRPRARIDGVPSKNSIMPPDTGNSTFHPRYNRGDPRQDSPAELLRPCCQPMALVISEPQASIVNLFAENPIFLYQITDHLLLALIDPTAN